MFQGIDAEAVNIAFSAINNKNVFGILAGIVAAETYNRFGQVKLPMAFSFFWQATSSDFDNSGYGHRIGGFNFPLANGIQWTRVIWWLDLQLRSHRCWFIWVL